MIYYSVGTSVLEAFVVFGTQFINTYGLRMVVGEVFDRFDARCFEFYVGRTQ
jgi:hypothetical protein